MTDPREVGKLFFEIRIDGLDEFWERRYGTGSAGLFERKDAFDPSVSFLALSSIAPFAPEYAEAYGPFGPIIGGLDAVFLQKDPEGIHLLDEQSSEHAGVVLSFFMRKHQVDEAGVECVPLTPAGRVLGLSAKKPQLLKCPLTETAKGLILSLRKSLGSAAGLHQGGLPASMPG